MHSPLTQNAVMILRAIYELTNKDGDECTPAQIHDFYKGKMENYLIHKNLKVLEGRHLLSCKREVTAHGGSKPSYYFTSTREALEEILKTLET